METKRKVIIVNNFTHIHVQYMGNRRLKMEIKDVKRNPYQWYITSNIVGSIHRRRRVINFFEKARNFFRGFLPINKSELF